MPMWRAGAEREQAPERGQGRGPEQAPEPGQAPERGGVRSRSWGRSGSRSRSRSRSSSRGGSRSGSGRRRNSGSRSRSRGPCGRRCRRSGHGRRGGCRNDRNGHRRGVDGESRCSRRLGGRVARGRLGDLRRHRVQLDGRIDRALGHRADRCRIRCFIRIGLVRCGTERPHGGEHRGEPGSRRDPDRPSSSTGRMGLAAQRARGRWPWKEAAEQAGPQTSPIASGAGGGNGDDGAGDEVAAACAGRSVGFGVCPRLARRRAIRSSGVSSLIGYLRSRLRCGRPRRSRGTLGRCRWRR